MRERFGTLSAKCKPKIFQNVPWEATAINAQELATAKPVSCVGTLERSQGWALGSGSPAEFPLCVFLAELFYLVRLTLQARKGLSDISLSSWPPVFQEMSWFINSLQKQ